MDTDPAYVPREEKQMEQPSTSSAQVQSPHTLVRPKHTIHKPQTSSSSDAGEGRETCCDSAAYARSTLDDALTSSKRFLRSQFGEVSSDTSCAASPVREAGRGSCFPPTWTPNHCL